MTTTNPQNRWRVALYAALCAGAAILITVEPSAKLHAQAPAGRGRGAVPPGDALFTSAQAVAGKTAYERNCASCHGANVDDGNSAPPLRGAAFLGKYGGKPAADLFTYVSTKMPPGNPGSISRHRVRADHRLGAPAEWFCDRTEGVRIGCGSARFRDDSRSAGRTRRRWQIWRSA